jgi:hypothetical protein
VEALNTTTIRRLTRSRRHQLLAIAPASLTGLVHPATQNVTQNTDALKLLTYGFNNQLILLATPAGLYASSDSALLRVTNLVKSANRYQKLTSKVANLN